MMLLFPVTCYKLMSEDIKRMIVLDLYFLNILPIIKRKNKEELNITINYINLDNNKKIIREKMVEFVIWNSFISFCTIDMNTIIDSEYNSLEYEEVAVMEIKNNNNNKYYKNTITI